jgi:hypothetical protein
MTTRRRLIKTFCALPILACLAKIGNAQDSPTFSQLKTRYAPRLKKILANGKLPYIDIESSCNSSSVDIEAIARSMDRFNIGLPVRSFPELTDRGHR